MALKMMSFCVFTSLKLAMKVQNRKKQTLKKNFEKCHAHCVSWLGVPGGQLCISSSLLLSEESLQGSGRDLNL